MRITPILLASLALISVPTVRAEEEGDGGGQFKSEELNFEIRTPEDSLDWVSKTIDPEQNPRLRVWFHSEYADSDAYAFVQVFVQKITSGLARTKLDKLADKWKESIEGGIDNVHDRKDGIEEWAGVETYKCSLEGTMGTGNHARSWYLLRNGEYLYTIIVDRHLAAAKDETVGEEVDAILKSFKFGEIRKVKADRKAKDEDAPEAPGGKGGKKPEEAGPKIDPEKLKAMPVQMDFWRFKCEKPEGLVALDVDEKATKQGIKAAWQGDDPNKIRLGIRIYVWSLQSTPYTLDQLAKTRMEHFEKRFKQSKVPEFDKNYDKSFPLAKKAYRLEMIGRSTRREKWLYLLAECKNDRQYMIEIYSMGDSSDKVWGKAVEKFIKSFETLKD